MPIDNYREKPSDDKAMAEFKAWRKGNRQTQGAKTTRELAAFNQPLNLKKAKNKETKEYKDEEEYLSKTKINMGLFKDNAPKIMDAHYQTLQAKATGEDKKALEKSHGSLNAIFGMLIKVDLKGLTAIAGSLFAFRKIDAEQLNTTFDNITIGGEQSLAYVKHLIKGLNIIAGYPENDLLGDGFGMTKVETTLVNEGKTQIERKLQALCAKVDAYYLREYSQGRNCQNLMGVLKQDGRNLAPGKIQNLDVTVLAKKLADIQGHCAQAEAEIKALDQRISQIGSLGKDPAQQFQTAIGSYKPPEPVVADVEKNLRGHRENLEKQLKETREKMLEVKKSLDAALLEPTSSETAAASTSAAPETTAATNTTVAAESAISPTQEAKVASPVETQEGNKGPSGETVQGAEVFVPQASTEGEPETGAVAIATTSETQPASEIDTSNTIADQKAADDSIKERSLESQAEEAKLAPLEKTTENNTPSAVTAEETGVPTQTATEKVAETQTAAAAPPSETKQTDQKEPKDPKKEADKLLKKLADNKAVIKGETPGDQGTALKDFTQDIPKYNSHLDAHPELKKIRSFGKLKYRDYTVNSHSQVNQAAITLMKAELDPLIKKITAANFMEAGAEKCMEALREFEKISKPYKDQCKVLGIEETRIISPNDARTIEAKKEAVQKAEAKSLEEKAQMEEKARIEEKAAVVAQVAKDLFPYQVNNPLDDKAMNVYIEAKYTGNTEFKAQCAKLRVSPDNLIEEAKNANKTNVERAALVADSRKIFDELSSPEFISNPAYREATEANLASFKTQCKTQGITLGDPLTTLIKERTQAAEEAAAQTAKEVAALVNQVAKDLAEYQITAEPDDTNSDNNVNSYLEKKYAGNNEFQAQCTKLKVNLKHLIEDAKKVEQPEAHKDLVKTGQEILKSFSDAEFTSNPEYRRNTLEKLNNFARACKAQDINVDGMVMGIHKHAAFLHEKENAEEKATVAAAAAPEKQAPVKEKTSLMGWFRSIGKGESEAPKAANGPKKEPVVNPGQGSSGTRAQP